MAGVNDNLIPRKKGEPALPGAGRPKGSKSLSTKIRKFLENPPDWKLVPIKGSSEFAEKYPDKDAADILIMAAFADAMSSNSGRGAARDWLRRGGYGDKIQIGGDEDNPVPILASIVKEPEKEDTEKT